MEDTVLSVQSETQVKRRRIILNNKIRLFILVVLILILAGLPSYYFYNQYQKAQVLLQGSKTQNNADVQEIITAVGKLMELPKGEQPTIATVSDFTKLTRQPFFNHAQNGDKVLIYTQAKKAILYRPSINKIIEVSVVNMSSDNQAPSPSAQTQSPTPSVAPATAAATPSGTPIQ